MPKFELKNFKMRQRTYPKTLVRQL